MKYLRAIIREDIVTLPNLYKSSCSCVFVLSLFVVCVCLFFLWFYAYMLHSPSTTKSWVFLHNNCFIKFHTTIEKRTNKQKNQKCLQYRYGKRRHATIIDSPFVSALAYSRFHIDALHAARETSRVCYFVYMSPHGRSLRPVAFHTSTSP